MDGRCKTCKWWDVWARSKPAGRSPMSPERGKCGHPKVGNGNGDNSDGAMDSEAYGGIDTGPDFGCVHWEAK